VGALRSLLSDVERLLARTSGRPLSGVTVPRRERAAFDPGSVKALYSRRFSPHELEKKRAIWRDLAPFFAARFPPGTKAVLELGAGEGEFIEHVQAERRAAFDNDTLDVVFCSNVLEHLYDRDQVHLLIREVHHVLRPGGRFVILQPNIRYVGPAYYDFIDHRLELTAESVVEALEVGHFEVKEAIERFLPYTSKSRLSNVYWLVPLYIRMPLLWRLFGAQAFIVAEKPRGR
jgi:SAM-dependent methyltransferase